MRFNKGFLGLLFLRLSSMGLCSSNSSPMTGSSSVEEPQDAFTDQSQFRLLKEGLPSLPIVYNENYDIALWNLEKVYPFDTKKWGKIHGFLTRYLESRNMNFSFITPIVPVSNKDLSIAHTRRFVQQIHTSSSMIATAVEVPYLMLVPVSSLRNRILTPMKWQVAGSLVAAHEALKRGWAINLGGGFHHASAHKAEGFCLFADITLIMKRLWHNVDRNYKFMIIDLDAHQGNGYERDVLIFTEDQRAKVYIFDMYHSKIFPMDNVAKDAIRKNIEIDSNLSEADYLIKLEQALHESFSEFQPSLVIYNAGTDCMVGDPLGKLNLTADGIQRRDAMVFEKARSMKTPIVMLTSGGYQMSNAQVIAKSIQNLFEQGLLPTSSNETNKM